MMTDRVRPQGRLFPILFLGCVAVSCGGEDSTSGGPPVADDAPEAPQSAPEEFKGGLIFTDVTEESGLGGFHQEAGDAEKSIILYTIGGGVALFDFDRDGDLDAWLTNGTPAPRAEGGGVALDALYANDGSGRFEEVTQAMGIADDRYTNGVCTADLDGDGWTDVYLTNLGANALYHNLQGHSFEEIASQAGLDHGSWSTGAAFFDQDLDGDLDLYLVNYVDFDPATALEDYPVGEYRGVKVCFGPRGLPGAPDRFFRNTGQARFEDASAQVGVEGAVGYGFTAIAFDPNEDGWTDIYVANDSVPNYLWVNQGGQGLEEGAFKAGLALSMGGSEQAGMGIAVGDWDGDLDLDLYTTNFAEDYFTFYRHERPGRFIDVTRRLRLASVTHSALGWGCGFVDFDLDGDLDLFAINGHVYPQVDQFELGTRYLQRNLVFENDGDGSFSSPEGNGGPGFALEAASRGAAAGDIDGDGDADLLVGNLDGPPTLLRNDSPRRGSWLRVRLEQGGENRAAFGARVVVTAPTEGGEIKGLRVVGSGGSFLSSAGPWLHFGLGQAREVRSISVRWPDGEEVEYGPFGVDQALTIER